MRFPWKRDAQHPESAPARTRGGLDVSALEGRVGEYVTDGVALFRVEDVLASSVEGELFLQLEDCRTLELVLWPAESRAALQVRTVTPSFEIPSPAGPHDRDYALTCTEDLGDGACGRKGRSSSWPRPTTP